MALGDFAMYLAVLSAIGWVPLAVTTNLSINFLRKPPARDLIAEARLLKLGKQLAVGEVGDDRLVGPVLDPDQALFECDVDPVALGPGEQRLIERGAGHVHRGLAEAPRHVVVDRT